MLLFVFIVATEKDWELKSEEGEFRQSAVVKRSTPQVRNRRTL